MKNKETKKLFKRALIGKKTDTSKDFFMFCEAFNTKFNS